VSVSERVARGRETSRRRRSSRRHRSWRWLSAERHISGAGRTIRPAGYGYRSLVASRCALAAIAAIRRLRPAEPLADQPADRGGGLVDVDPDRADEQWFRGIARGRVPLVALHPNPRRQGPIRVEPPRERLAVERLAERRFEPGLSS